MICQICERKVIRVQKRTGKYYKTYLKHGEYITTWTGKSEFDYHKPEVS